MSALTPKRLPLLISLLAAMALTVGAVPGAASAARDRGASHAPSASSNSKQTTKGGSCTCPRGTSDPSYCENDGHDDGHGHGHDDGHGHGHDDGHGHGHEASHGRGGGRGR